MLDKDVNLGGGSEKGDIFFIEKVYKCFANILLMWIIIYEKKKLGFKKSNVGQSKVTSLFKKNKYIIMAIMKILCYTSRRKQ